MHIIYTSQNCNHANSFRRPNCADIVESPNFDFVHSAIHQYTYSYLGVTYNLHVPT